MRALAIVAACLLAGCTGTAPSGTPAAEPAPVAAGGIALPPFERVTLPSGTVLILAPKRDVPLVALHAMVRGGAVADTPERSGLANLTAQLLEKGSLTRDASAFAEAVDAAGGVLGASGGVEAVQIAAEFLSRDTALMIELVADMLKAPRFDADEFEKLRGRTIDFLRSARDTDPRPLVGIYGHAFLFGEHPYGRSVAGNETALAQLTRENVLAHYAAHYGGDRLIVSVVGDFDVDAVRAQLRSAFGDWRRAGVAAPAIASPPPQSGRRVLLIDKPDATQTYFWLGNTGVARDYPQRAALDVANTIFGGRFTSMLNTALRIESGLSYGARSHLVRPSRAGSIAIVSFTATESTVEAIDLALATLTRFRGAPPSAQTLSSARAYILGQTPPSLETAAQVAGQLAALAFYGLDRDHIDGYAQAVAAVSAAQVAATIEAVYPSAEDLTMVLIGNAAAIRGQVARYGEVTEMAIEEPTFAPAAR